MEGYEVEVVGMEDEYDGEIGLPYDVAVAELNVLATMCEDGGWTVEYGIASRDNLAAWIARMDGRPKITAQIVRSDI